MNIRTNTYLLAFPLTNFYLVYMLIGRRYILLLLGTLLSLSGKAQTVYKTPSGAKYHLASCRMVKNVSEEMTIEKARALGLEPCKICNPQQAYAQPVSPANKAQGQNVTVQCKGLTKSGTRCKHMTRIANGYCFQHQPD